MGPVRVVRARPETRERIAAVELDDEGEGRAARGAVRWHDGAIGPRVVPSAKVIARGGVRVTDDMFVDVERRETRREFLQSDRKSVV